ncbi:hypothetical protein C496_15367 [Natronorubrum tibetense GA33]|uniref:DUF7282 domain-containing protein n=2 Tax=Natronorubrum tibetense TaxID=63128 RepID=L9VQ05_9EURY|nr:hypothetical protein C496_15367 [Natronorubrum tibetense GA33]
MVAGAAPAATLDEHDEDEYDDTDAGEDTNADGDDADPNDVPDEEVDPPENGDMDAEATVTFTDQELENDTVVVDEVTVEDGGFVVIHDSSLLAGNVVESVIGASEYLDEGTHENVEVTLDEPLEEDETLIAMAHFDTNDNEEYDFVETDGAEDGPYLTADDEPVTDEAIVTVDAASEETPDETPEAAEEEPVSEEPVDEEVADADEEPVEEEPADVDPDDADDEPPEEEPDAVEEEPVAEEPADEEATDADEEPVDEEVEDADEEPVETEPVEEEPVEEEPEAVDDDTIDVLIEEVTIFVFFDELPHGEPADGDHVNIDANDVEGDDGLEGAAIDGDAAETDATTGDDAAHDDASETYDLDELGYTFTDIELNVTIETVTVVPIYDHHGDGHHHDADSGHHHANGEHHHDANNGTNGVETDSVDDAHDAADHDEYDIVIEHASVFVFVGDLGELPHHPIDDESAEHNDDAVDDADDADTQPAIASAL